MKHPHASAFLTAQPACLDATTVDTAALETALVAIIATARARYSGIRVSDADYLRHLAARVDPELPVMDAIALLRTADLLLACGCATGDRTAVGLLESECIRGAQGALGKRAVSSEIAEEANQIVRERLLVGDGTPKVLEYDGKGDLKSWVRIVVVREAIYLSKRGKKEVPLSLDLLSLPTAQDNPEVAYFKAHYRTEYKDAFEAAVDELTSRERALLRQQLVLGMSVDEIGAVYQVHRATAARWVQSARDQVLAKARLQLAIRLDLPRADIENIVRMIESQLEMSMDRLLKASEV